MKRARFSWWFVGRWIFRELINRHARSITSTAYVNLCRRLDVRQGLNRKRPVQNEHAEELEMLQLTENLPSCKRRIVQIALTCLAILMMVVLGGHSSVEFPADNQLIYSISVHEIEPNDKDVDNVKMVHCRSNAACQTATVVSYRTLLDVQNGQVKELDDTSFELRPIFSNLYRPPKSY